MSLSKSTKVIERESTGTVLLDLPSPYEAHPCGLLHLPRFLAKIKKHLQGDLPASYQRNFTKGFDGFLCLHLGLAPSEIIELVKLTNSAAELDKALLKIFPSELKPEIWNRKVVQMGMAEMALEKLQEIKESMGISSRKDIRSFADIIDFDEEKIS